MLKPNLAVFIACIAAPVAAETINYEVGAEYMQSEGGRPESINFLVTEDESVKLLRASGRMYLEELSAENVVHSELAFVRRASYIFGSVEFATVTDEWYRDYHWGESEPEEYNYRWVDIGCRYFFSENSFITADVDFIKWNDSDEGGEVINTGIGHYVGENAAISVDILNMNNSEFSALSVAGHWLVARESGSHFAYDVRATAFKTDFPDNDQFNVGLTYYPTLRTGYGLKAGKHYVTGAFIGATVDHWLRTKLGLSGSYEVAAAGTVWSLGLNGRF